MNGQDTFIQKMQENHRLELSRISHEIRNPVTLINSSMQIIESEHPEVTSFAFWKEMREDMAYLRRLLDEFSGFNNSDKLCLADVNLTELLHTVTSQAKALSPNQEIAFYSTVPLDLPTIVADATKLRQAITNVLRNAFETDASQVKLSCSASDGQVKIDIQNNGSEIPKEYLPDLFTPFITHKKNGTGLGLAIVKRIIEAHHGQIILSSNPAGTCFSLRLPINTNASTKPDRNPPR